MSDPIYQTADYSSNTPPPPLPSAANAPSAAPAAQQQPGNFWSDLANKVATAGYSGFNELGMGLPDYIVKKVLPSDSYQVIKDMQAKNPTASTVGGLAGDVASMLIPVGGEYKAASKLLGGAKTGLGRLMAKGAKVATSPATGLVPNIGRGIVQALPQVGIRTATGNITPDQGALGLAIGGGAGALSGLLGKAAPAIAGASGAADEAGGFGSKLINSLRNANDQTLIGALGGNGSMVRATASFGLKAPQLMTKAAREKNLIQRAAQIIAEDGITNEAKLAQSLQNRYTNVWNALDNAWENNGIKLMDNAQDLATNKSLKGLQALAPDKRMQFLNQALPIADEQSGLANVTKYLTDDFINVNPRGSGTTDIKKLRDAAIDVKNYAQELAKNAALKEGTLNPQLAETFQKDYPAIVLLKKINEGKAKQVFGAGIGSDTAMKALSANGLGAPLLGGVAGYETGDTGEDKLRNAAIGALAVGGLGNMANQLATKGTNAAMLRASLFGRKLLGEAPQMAAGAGGAAAAAGGGGIANVAAQAAHKFPILERMTGIGKGNQEQAQPSELQGELGVDNIPTVNPETVKMDDLMRSDNPYLKSIGTQLKAIWGQSLGMMKNPDGTQTTPDQLAQMAAKQTGGFKNIRQVAGNILYRNNPQRGEEFVRNYNMANVIHNIDWKNLIDTIKPMWQGGQKQLKGMPWNKAAMDQLNQFAEASGIDPRVAIGDVQRIADTPGYTDKQKEQLIINRFINLYSQKNGFNPADLQALGMWGNG